MAEFGRFRVEHVCKFHTHANADNSTHGKSDVVPLLAGETNRMNKTAGFNEQVGPTWPWRRFSELC